jgi:DNA-binding NarL/FixJ family response regulator
MTIGVVIADDQALVRAGFRVLIDSAPDMAVLAEAADGTEAVTLTRQHQPDVVLMDMRMPTLDGVEATRQITGGDMDASPRVLVLTTFDIDEYVYAALQAGASGFLLKDTLPENLLDAVRIVAAGDSLLAPRVTRSSRLAPPTAAPTRRPSSCSPNENVKYWSKWPAACRTTRSPAGCT